MSRRIFLGALGGAAAAVVVAPALVTPTGKLFDPVSNIAIKYVSGNMYLTPQMITEECLRILNNNLAVARSTSRDFEHEFRNNHKIGNVIVRRFSRLCR